MNDLVKFNFSENEIRTTINNGDVWVVAKDVLQALEYTESSNIGKTVNHVPEKWKGRYPITTPGGIQNLWCLLN